MNTAIKKYIIGGILVVAFVLYFVFSNNGSTPVATTPDSTSTSGGSTTPSSTAPTSTPTSGGTPTPTPSQGQYKDGTYTGPVTDAIYGSMQVSAVISGGKLTDVKFLKYPNDAGHTQEVSADALPKLKQEAIAAQSANVSVVSGATQTTDAFKESLKAALAQAQS